ncbi:hypothetical protein L227DRAFT_658045 [Lentinus tigrinus ALCF2SS1-6]|uniref:DUF6534 domain-containing protein n=1 Tax=Lentinus tigrinus ALCF2SS1-6 TaxID=1328759 RepID=A0A5C2RQ40_9APHY|nr:hypothetical protein L227DRAFT_658045 [Lentinus tigrinus ALCF2SS1-6]
MDSLASQMLDGLDRNGTIGMGYLGVVVSSLIYGVTCVQSFHYYRSPKGQGDPMYLRLFVLVMWVFDTLHQVLVVYAFYHYLVTGYGLPATLIYLSWSIPASLVVNMMAICSLSLEVATTVSYTGTLIFYLNRGRSEIERSNNMVSKIVIMAISSSSLSAVVAIATLFAYTLAPTKLYNLFFEFILETVDVNAVLTSLNSRESLNKAAVSSTTNFNRPIPAVPSQIVQEDVQLDVVCYRVS